MPRAKKPGLYVPKRPKVTKLRCAHLDEFETAVRRAAKTAGIDAGVFRSHLQEFFTEAVSAICRGRIVVVPEFGTFIPYSYARDKKRPRWKQWATPVATLRFIPSHYAQAKVMLTCPLSETINAEMYHIAQRNALYFVKRTARRMCAGGESAQPEALALLGD